MEAPIMNEAQRQKLVDMLKELQLETLAVQVTDLSEYENETEYLVDKLHWTEVQIERWGQEIAREAEHELELYKLIFGEIKDPYGKVDTMIAVKTYKENEDFHQNFGRYMEAVRAKLELTQKPPQPSQGEVG